MFVLGHSWGNIMGLRLAAAHPEWLYAYIGMGQGTNVPESERRGWAWTLAQAQADHNEVAIRELRALAPYTPDSRPVPLRSILTERKWLNHYGGAAFGTARGLNSSLQRSIWHRNILTTTCVTPFTRAACGDRGDAPRFLPPIFRVSISCACRFCCYSAVTTKTCRVRLRRMVRNRTRTVEKTGLVRTFRPSYYERRNPVNY